MDLVCVNLYPFEQTVARGDASEAEVIENIDIGGPTMIRAAAKNSDFAAVVVDPADYQPVLEELRLGRAGCRCRRATGSRRRRSRAPRATTPRSPAGSPRRTFEGFPPMRFEAYEKQSDLRYGENPHQSAAYYARVGAAHAPAAGRRAAARQGAVVQQPARPQRRPRARRGVLRAGLRDRQAQQPVRLRGRADRPARLRARLRLRPAERIRRRHRRQPAASTSAFARRSSPDSSSRSCSPPASMPARSRCSRPRRTCACSSCASWPEPARGARVQGGDGRAAAAEPRRRQRDARADARAQLPASRPSRSGRTCCSPGASAATCAPTRS